MRSVMSLTVPAIPANSAISLSCNTAGRASCLPAHCCYLAVFYRNLLFLSLCYCRPLYWSMNRMNLSERWKSWKPTRKACCIAPFQYLSSTPKVSCFCSNGLQTNITPAVCGPIPAAATPSRMKTCSRHRIAGSGKKWGLIAS